MELYWTIHILVFISTIFEFSSLRMKKTTIIVWCIFFTIFGGLRWFIGNDWDQYYGHFQYCKWTNIFNYDRFGNGSEKLEPGFVFINILIKSIFGKFYWYNLIIIGFQQFSFYKFSNYFSPKRPLILYTTLMSVVCYFPVREGFALSISMWCFQFIKEKRLKPFLLCAIGAASIHYMCALMIPMYWIGRIRPKFLIYSIAYFTIAISSAVLIDYFTTLSIVIGGDIGDKAIGYTEFETEGFSKGSTYMGILLQYFFLCIFIWIRKAERLQKCEWYTAFLNMYFLFYSLYMTFSNGYGDLARLSSVFMPARNILYFTMLNYFFDKKNKVIVVIAILFYIAYYIYGFRDGIGGYFFKLSSVPYKNIFDYNIHLF